MKTGANTTDKLNVLILDDEQGYRDELADFLRDNGMNAFKAGVPSLAMNVMRKNKIQILIADIQLPEMDGLKYLERVRKKYPDTEVIMITGHGDMNQVIQAMRLGAIDFLTKPFGLGNFLKSVRKTKSYKIFNEEHDTSKINQFLQTKYIRNGTQIDFIGNSDGIREINSLIKKVAVTDNTSVLLMGESGTGKELLARAVHNLSGRRHNRFVAVNCSAVPENLFESEFFGHTKGSYTGAIDSKEGWFELANGGTLFLDEIADMPFNMQTKLLRVLEERKVRRIGSLKDIDVDVRIIAATNQHIEEKVFNEKFREDLYYRLNTFEVCIPPLRERKEDIPLLVDFYLKYFNRKMEKHITSIEKKTLMSLADYDYFGNVRELKNMMERAVIMCDGRMLKYEHFQFNRKRVPHVVGSKAYDQGRYNLELTEKKLIVETLKETNFNKSEAAKLLNISRQSLDRRLRKL